MSGWRRVRGPHFLVARLLVGAVAVFFPSSHFGIIIVLYSSFRGRAFGTSLMESNTILLSDLARRGRFGRGGDLLREPLLLG